jgi:hypothetical protein
LPIERQAFSWWKGVLTFFSLLRNWFESLDAVVDALVSRELSDDVNNMNPTFWALCGFHELEGVKPSKQV